MNTQKYNYARLIPARAKEAFMKACAEAEARDVVKELARKRAILTARDYHLTSEEAQYLYEDLYAIGIARQAQAHAETIEEYLKGYLRFKTQCYIRLHDTGAFGDLIETVCHLLAMRKRWRTQIRNLHVAAIGHTDVQIDGKRFEIGHNAKLWADRTPENAMEGPFEGVIYGMLTKEELACLIRELDRDLEAGVTAIADSMVVFEDKAEFFDLMQNRIGRTPAIVLRPDIGHCITQCNPSRINAWVKATEGQYPTLSEYMRSIGENDWLSD